VWCFRDLISVDDDYVAEHEAKILKEADMQVDRDLFNKKSISPGNVLDKFSSPNFGQQLRPKKQYINLYLNVQ
jgi:hypothetical protein